MIQVQLWHSDHSLPVAYFSVESSSEAAEQVSLCGLLPPAHGTVYENVTLWFD